MSDLVERPFTLSAARAALPGLAAIAEDLAHVVVRAAEELEADMNFSGPGLLLKAPEEAYPRLTAMPGVKVADAAEEMSAAHVVSALQAVLGEQSALLVKAHQSLAELRRNYHRLLERFEALERFAEANFPGGMISKFANVHAAESPLDMRDPADRHADVRIVQKMPVASIECRLIELVLTLSRPLTAVHQCRLVLVGSGKVLAHWILDENSVRASGVLRLSLPEIPPPAEDMELVFDFAMSQEQANIALGGSYRKADPHTCASLNGARGERPLHMKIWNVAPGGTRLAYEQALRPVDSAQAGLSRQLAAERFLTTQLVHPLALKNHAFALVTPREDGGVLVHPVMNDITCAAMPLPEGLTGGERLRVSLANRHDENEGVEMALGFVKKPFKPRDAVRIFSNPVLLHQHVALGEWQFLAPGERRQVTVRPEQGVDMERLLVLSRIPEGATDRYVWAVLEGAIIETAGDA